MLKLLDLSVGTNVSLERIEENILSAAERQLLWVSEIAPNDATAVLVGGGPSLGDHVSKVELRALAEGGAHIFALGNSAGWLRDNGFPIHAQVMVDAREQNKDFLLPDADWLHLIASQCDPAVFDALAAKDVRLWHPLIIGMEKKIPPKQPYHMIGGSYTVGLSAMCLAYTLGYRVMHLFGYDSSSRGPQAGHAFNQTLGVSHGEQEVVYAGQTFWAHPGMLAQAREFPRLAAQLANLDVTIRVHGTGLLPLMARIMQNPPPERWVMECDLGRIPSRWDFFNWLSAVDMDRRHYGVKSLAVKFTAGPNEGFRADGLPETIEQRQQQLDKVLRPLLSMIGAEETDEQPSFTSHEYLVSAVVDRYRRGMPLPQYDAGDLARERVNHFLLRGERPIVITLREAPHWPARNSIVEAWCAFARTCGHPVVFVRDTAKAHEELDGFRIFPSASIDVKVRLALYERALVNMFVANGPCELALLSTHIPYLMFKPLVEEWGNCGTPEFWEMAVGIPHLGQFPWATPQQRIVWADDDTATIQAAFAEFLGRSARAAE